MRLQRWSARSVIWSNAGGSTIWEQFDILNSMFSIQTALRYSRLNNMLCKIAHIELRLATCRYDLWIQNLIVSLELARKMILLACSRCEGIKDKPMAAWELQDTTAVIGESSLTSCPVIIKPPRTIAWQVPSSRLLSWTSDSSCPVCCAGLIKQNRLTVGRKSIGEYF